MKRHYHGLETIDKWVMPEVLGMSDEIRLDFENKINALNMYQNGNPLSEIKLKTGISRQNLYYLLHRCTNIDINGKVVGYSGLIKGKQAEVARYNDSNKLSEGKPTSGALQALLIKYPSLATMMNNLILKGLVPDSTRTNKRLTWHHIHEVFLTQCTLLGLRPPQYPFCSYSNGKIALMRWGKRLIAEDAASQLTISVSKNEYFEEYKLPASRCYERVEADGHSIDVNWTIEVPSLIGPGVISVKISRLWLITLLETNSTAAIGYSIALGRNYNASDVTRAIQSSLVPWKPRNLTLSTIAYKPGECLPNALLPELAYVCYDEIWLDNAKSHLSNIFFTTFERTVNAVPVFGPKGSPNVRPRIELLFDLLEEAGIHCMDGTTGSNSSDKRKQPKEDDRLLLSLDTLMDLIDLLIVRYNTGICPGTTISRNEVLKRAVTRGTDIFRRIPLSKRENCLKYSTYDTATIGSEKGEPILRWKNARYDGLGLHLTAGLIGQEVLVMAEEDIRIIEVVLLKDGTSLGKLEVEKRWRNTAHSIFSRTVIKRYMTNNSFISHAADIPLAFRQHIEQQLKNSAKNKRVLAQLQKEQKEKINKKQVSQPSVGVNDINLLNTLNKRINDPKTTEKSHENVAAIDTDKNVLDEIIMNLGATYR